jgi:inosose dehydratase
MKKELIPESLLNRPSARRQFLKQMGTAALAWGAASRCLGAFPAPLPNPVGYSTIAWPDGQYEPALEGISEVGFKGAQLMGEIEQSFPGDKVLELREKLHKLNLVATCMSCHGVSLAPGKPSDQAVEKFREYVKFMKALGGPFLQVTDGGKPNVQYSADDIKTLGAAMTKLGKIAKDSGITLGYHPHFGMLGESREGVSKVMDSTDPAYVSIIVDVAHLTLGGSDPAEVIRTYHQRLAFFHMKDIRKDTFDAVKQNHDAGGRIRLRFCEIGHGVLDFKPITAAIREVHFQGWVVVELDRYVPAPGGPMESARINKTALEQLGFRV